MTAREYLSQAYLLEQRIASDIRKAESVRALASSLSLPAADTVRVSASPSGEASFIRILEKAEAIEERIAAERRGTRMTCSRRCRTSTVTTAIRRG